MPVKNDLAEARQRAIETLLLWEGQASNSRLREFFTVHASQAARDLAAYRGTAPYDVSFDVGSRAYVATETLAPRLTKGTFSEYASLIGAPSYSAFNPGVPAAFEHVSLENELVKPSVFRSLHQAIANGHRCAVDLPNMVIRSVTIVPLRSPLDCWREAVAMRNCLHEAVYRRKANGGGYALVSMRVPGKKRPLATFEMYRRCPSVGNAPQQQNFWSVGEIRLAFNRNAPDEVWRIARDYADQVNVQIGREFEAMKALEAPKRKPPKSFRFKVLRFEHGMLHLRIGAGRKNIDFRISDTEDSFQGIFNWLEAITTGVMQASCETSGEGRPCKFSYRNSFDGFGLLTVTADEQPPLRAHVLKHELVSTIYRTLRAYVESPEGRDINWERGRLWDVLESCLPVKVDRGTMLKRLASWPRNRVVLLLQHLSRMQLFGPEAENDIAVTTLMLESEDRELTGHADSNGDMIALGFDGWPEPCRIRAVDQGLRAGVPRGPRILCQRSPLVEAWIRAPC